MGLLAGLASAACPPTAAEPGSVARAIVGADAAIAALDPAALSAATTTLHDAITCQATPITPAEAADIHRVEGIAAADPAPVIAPAATAAPPAPPPAMEAPTPPLAAPPSPRPVRATPQPAPSTPAPAPPAAPIPTAPDPAPPSGGTFRAAGDAESLWLVRGGSLFEPGPVESGSYTVAARFPGRPVKAVDGVVVSVRAGEVVTITCVTGFYTCRVN